MKLRLFLSAALLGVAAIVSFVFNAPATPALGQIAGKQFKANNLSYLATQGAFRA